MTAVSACVGMSCYFPLQKSLYTVICELLFVLISVTAV